MNPRCTLRAASVLGAVLLPLVVPQAASAACDPDRIQPSGAVYRICMPEAGRWNGSLVIWAHGYIAFNRPVGLPEEQMNLPDGTPLADLVNRLGYAFAATSYSVNGLAVRQGLADVIDLVGIFRATKGPARRTYLVGASEGGLITTLAVEQRPDLFSGGLATCGPIGDFAKQLEYVGDFRVLFDYFYPGLLPGVPTEIPADLIENWDTHFAHVIRPAVFAPANRSRTQQLLRTSNAPVDPGNPEATAAQSIYDALWYNVFATNDAFEKLGGPSVDTTRRIYFGSANDLLLNLRVRRLRADPDALAEIRAHYDTTGVLRRPLVTMHTLRDQQVPQWHQTLYQLKALGRGSAGQLVSLPIDRYGHCNFTAPELLIGFNLLVLRVELRSLFSASQAALPARDRAGFAALAGQHRLPR